MFFILFFYSIFIILTFQLISVAEIDNEKQTKNINAVDQKTESTEHLLF